MVDLCEGESLILGFFILFLFLFCYVINILIAFLTFLLSFI